MMPRMRRLVWPALASLIALAILVGLGTWQMQRRAWKIALIAERQAGLTAPPVALPEQLDGLEFRRVTVTGRFDHHREITVLNQTAGQQTGLHVVTPLVLADGGTVLINRGFVPRGALAQASRPTGEVTLTGLLRGSYGRNRFTPDDRPAQGEWFAFDPLAMAKALDLPAARPFLIDADATANPGGLPIGGQTRTDLPNDHLHYALTWYGLALTLIIIFAVFARSRWRAVPAGSDRSLPARPDNRDSSG